ncbi:uncharacterized protein N0V89_009475 [Didymosphaeria variabile]|uniref:Heterokaryon incompatibility domain-containing protein n=1 Tax=Didymosphaeria variabile TaxID=1932322 RepID=A0A9W9C7A9_9PLEO|nr:uncharacterized protein N0V89_009475 [Didymosphaeria variabile]KAJ4348103.1 hypothetical protein N0V89_009475 [Didymosphaeria variabile]
MPSPPARLDSQSNKKHSARKHGSSPARSNIDAEANIQYEENLEVPNPGLAGLDIHLSSTNDGWGSVPSTRLENSQNTPEAAYERASGSRTPVRLHNKAHGDRIPSLQIPLAVPGSFPSPPDSIQPEDSRSETSPTTKRLSSGDARSLASGSTLRQSVSLSVSGVLGEKVYQYKQLSAFQFRLVRILPKTMSLIKCELAAYSLEDPPGYIAISYAWGDTDDKKRVQLEGVDVPVSASLHGALFALRAKKESVLVWVDALSIDQQNVAERTQQVQLMTYIYSRAISVAIWLGPEADDSTMAMETLSEATAQSTDSERIESLMSSEHGKAQLSSVVTLFEREYWSRLWVVQEVFNAQEITVYCGATSLPWSVYRLATNVFWRHKSLIDHYFPGSLSHGGQRASSTQFTYSQVLVYHGPSSIPDVSSFYGLGEESLLEVMRVCRRKLSADPRDKLYGILGLLPEDIRNEFPVDYSLSVKEVYVRVFDYLLCTTERLDVLCETVHFPLHTSSNLPSWVPDWSHNPETTSLGRLCNSSAAGSVKAVARVLDDRRKLEISAIYLDTIRSHGIAVGTLCTLADYVMAFIHWRAQLLSNTKDDESEARQEDFCRTLSLDQLPPGWKDGSWRAACYHVFASLAHERIPRLPLDEELWRYVDVNAGVKAEDRRRFLQEHFGSRMMGRCFCITEDGSIGMGSGFMAAGDTVVVPLGCPTPVLLRPEGPRGEYRYVGDVYIHGYMDGRAVKHWQSGERELRKFVLH